MNSKKFYESPKLEKCSFCEREELMSNTPSISDVDYGWADIGPLGSESN